MGGSPRVRRISEVAFLASPALRGHRNLPPVRKRHVVARILECEYELFATEHDVVFTLK